MRGVITRVFFQRGFAFLRGEDNISRFVHCQDVVPVGDFDHFHEGLAVTFTPARDDGGKGNKERAVEVRKHAV